MMNLRSLVAVSVAALLCLGGCANTSTSTAPKASSGPSNEKVVSDYVTKDGVLRFTPIVGLTVKPLVGQENLALADASIPAALVINRVKDPKVTSSRNWDKQVASTLKNAEVKHVYELEFAGRKLWIWQTNLAAGNIALTAPVILTDGSFEEITLAVSGDKAEEGRKLLTKFLASGKFLDAVLDPENSANNETKEGANSNESETDKK